MVVMKPLSRWDGRTFDGMSRRREGDGSNPFLSKVDLNKSSDIGVSLIICHSLSEKTLQPPPLHLSLSFNNVVTKAYLHIK